MGRPADTSDPGPARWQRFTSSRQTQNWSYCDDGCHHKITVAYIHRRNTEHSRMALIPYGCHTRLQLPQRHASSNNNAPFFSIHVTDVRYLGDGVQRRRSAAATCENIFTVARVTRDNNTRDFPRAGFYKARRLNHCSSFEKRLNTASTVVIVNSQILRFSVLFENTFFTFLRCSKNVSFTFFGSVIS